VLAVLQLNFNQDQQQQQQYCALSSPRRHSTSTSRLAATSAAHTSICRNSLHVRQQQQYCALSSPRRHSTSTSHLAATSAAHTILPFAAINCVYDNDNNIAHYHPLVAILRRLPISLLLLLRIPYFHLPQFIACTTTTTILHTIIPSSPFYVDFPSRCYLCCTYFHLPQFIVCISLYGNIILPSSCRNTRIDLATGQLYIPILGKCYNILSLCFPSSSSLLVLFAFIAVSCICLQFYFVLCFIY
jgi:hypothetical protein